ncbi:MAG TPA: efflux RND transporter periplasmic adaptor subunit [Blastocatellia bacterium]|nr:efflux RND transporter periplasmic adaptor subunit [Blastocatellia bacterium]
MRLAIIIVLLQGCGWLLQGCGWAKSSRPRLTSQNGGEDGITPVKVSTAEAVARPDSLSINATGSFIADEVSDIATEAEGRVSATLVGIGDFVKKGEVIARLDDRAAMLRLRQAIALERQAEALLDQASARLGAPKDGNDEARAQAETPRSQTNVPERQEAAINAARPQPQGLAEAQAALEGARAQTALARKALSDTIIKAPFAGHISDRPAAPGEHVTPSAKIATLQRINPIKLRLQLPEVDAGLAQVGAMVTATVAAYPQRQFNGRVTAINPVVDPSSRTISIEVRIDNPESRLRPGMFATAQLHPSGGDEAGGVKAVFVPSQAVINDPATNSSHVYVLESDIARVRVVYTGGTIGPTDDGMIRIISGLSGVETVITSNLDKLFDGAKVIY